MGTDEKKNGRIKLVAQTTLPTKFGKFGLYAFEDDEGEAHLALVIGEVGGKEKVPVRIHSKCTTGDALGSLRCDCREQLEKAMEFFGWKKFGILLYMNQEGRGIGLLNKIKAYALQDSGLDTVEANHQLGFADDLRGYEAAALMLKWLDVKSILIMSNNPKKTEGLEKGGIRVDGRIPIISEENENNAKYLHTKREKMGHLLDEEDGV